VLRCPVRENPVLHPQLRAAQLSHTSQRPPTLQ
jgi:hypothetical protein